MSPQKIDANMIDRHMRHAHVIRAQAIMGALDSLATALRRAVHVIVAVFA